MKKRITSDVYLRRIFFDQRMIIILSFVIIQALPVLTMAQSPVSITEVDQVIPTYLSGPPEPNPMFFFNKQSQGAEGRIYPYPLYDNLTNKKGEKSYHLVYLENEYVKIGIMPEIGGRVFSALDKTNNYDFVYNQHVVKPALIGLIGSWISGGIEWNIPHHHRASTFLPVQWSKEENADGSKTIWVGELEVRQRMRWAVGYTLRPGSSILECSVRIINRTPVANTMLAFANVAVRTNENYQVIFPPSTEWATGHSKRDFYTWPNVNNADVSWYKNNRNSASWFAVNKKDDFVAGYDHGLNAGIMTIADHNVVPGKKFFTWGVGNIWDKILTDNDGPYLEIMVGAYSDNQPDYSWLQPFEERKVDLSWYPFRGIDGAKNANLDAAVNLDIKDGKAALGFYTTKAYEKATVYLKAGNKILAQEDISINPGKPYTKQITLPAGLDEHDLRASITVGGRELVAYSPVRLEKSIKPLVTTTPVRPADIKNDEELFLAGQRIDQFHNPGLDADPYWEEALRRDSGNVAANTGMGILSLRDAKFEAAEKYFRRAIDRLTFQYTTPKNAEPLYYLGLALKSQGRLDEAYTAYFKAAWSQEWKSPAYFSLAEIASIKGESALALKLVDQSLDANALNVRAYGLKAAILRQLGRNDEALKLVAFAMEKTDPLDARLMAEKWLAAKGVKESGILTATLNENPAAAQEIAAEYYNSGLWKDGTDVLAQAVASARNKTNTNPLVYYYLGYFAEKLGNSDKAAAYRGQAKLQSPEYVFPFQHEAIVVLRSAIAADPKDARAPYYLGNLLYDWQPEESVALWERSVAIDPSFAITWRNLSIAYSHQENTSATKSIASLEKAVAINAPYARHFAELDNFYQTNRESVQKRLALLEKNQKVVMTNDESLADLITLKTFAGKTDESIKMLQDRTFSIWEGGNPYNVGQAWSDAHLVRGIQKLSAKKYGEAIADFGLISQPTENLRAEQRYDQHIAQVNFLVGLAYDAMGEKDKAKEAWSKTITTAESLQAQVLTGGGGRRVGNNALIQGEQQYFQVLAKQKLGMAGDYNPVFEGLTKTAVPAQGNNGSQNATQGSQALLTTQRNLATSHYLRGLGYRGLGNKAKAQEEFNLSLKEMPDFLSAQIALTQND